MQSWEDPIADSRVTTSAAAPAVFTEPETATNRQPIPTVQPVAQDDTHTFEKTVSKPNDTAIVQATEALNKLRAEMEEEQTQSPIQAKHQEAKEGGVTGLESIEMGASLSLIHI